MKESFDNSRRPDYLAPKTEVVVVASYDERRGDKGRVVSDLYGLCVVQFPDEKGTRTFGRTALNPVLAVA
jgi:hypothetical protein